jgi:membrane fusion protein (multidrug efflux system)
LIKRFIIAFILLVIVCGGIVGFNLFRDKAIEDFFANMPVNPLTVSTARVEPITWTPNIEAIGTVSAASGVDLTVETTGIV